MFWIRAWYLIGFITCLIVIKRYDGCVTVKTLCGALAASVCGVFIPIVIIISHLEDKYGNTKLF